MKKSKSLRRQLFIVISFLIAFQSVIFIAVLTSSRVFHILDDESFRIFDRIVGEKSQELDAQLGILKTNLLREAENFNDIILEKNLTIDDNFNDRAFNSIMNILRNNIVTGAFIIVDKEYSKADSHHALYIRDSNPEFESGNTSQFTIELGPSSLAGKHKIALSPNWDIGLKIDDKDDFYNKPIEGTLRDPHMSLQEYGYFAPPFDILKDGKKVISYSLPLINSENKIFGVIGVEISPDLIAQSYLPKHDSSYNDYFYTLAKLNDNNEIDLSWYIPNKPVAHLYLSRNSTLKSEDLIDRDLRSVSIPSFDEMYCSSYYINLYDKSSAFSTDLALIGFISKEDIHQTSNNILIRLAASIIITVTIGLTTMFIINNYLTRRLSRLWGYLSNVDKIQVIDFPETKIKEIDKLTSTIEDLNKAVINNSKTTSKILELTNMPIACYEVENNNNQVFISHYLSDLLNLRYDSPVTKDEWENYYEVLISNPSENMENVYSYQHPRTGKTHWLKINEDDMDDGKIGTVMDITDEHEYNLHLIKELDYDYLTRLYNRAAFKRKIHDIVEDEPYKIGAMLFIDLDNLKYVNDFYGHNVGDSYIIKAGKVFSAFSKYGAIVSRISGDEFAIYIHGYDDKDSVLKLIFSTLEKYRKEFIALPDGERQRIRYSGGIAWYPEDSNNLNDLLKLADFAMYEAKHQSKGTIIEFNKQSYKENIYLFENREAINDLIDNSLIDFNFQPIVEINSGEIYGYEALMKPLQKSFNSPMEVLEVAKAEYKLNQLEKMIVFKVMEYFKDNQDLFEDKKLFVNSITNQTLSTKDGKFIRDEYKEILHKVVVEFIENEQIINKKIVRKINNIRKSGISIAIDDFGSGFSNEVQILDLEPDIIKVDIRIIRDIHKDSNKQHFLSNILSYSKSRGIKVVAEGVESKEELLYLKGEEVDFVQGYLIGYPDKNIKGIDDEILELIKN